MKACCRKIEIGSVELIPILSYPREINPQAYIRRLKEIDCLGVHSFLPAGNTKIGRLNVLGKGGVGVVAKVEAKDNKIYALKIRRVDANRLSMDREAIFLKMANLVGVGPSVYAITENFILMDYIDGWNIECWLSQHAVRSTQVRAIVTSALEQCYSLDNASLDHGELSSLSHHLLVSKDLKAQIIDFESSSMTRPPRNVTSISHALLLNGRISRLIGDHITIGKQEELVQSLKAYKRDKIRRNFERILKVLG